MWYVILNDWRIILKRKYDTLLLNKLYIPIHIIDWKRSINLLYAKEARSLDQDLLPYNFEDWVTLCNMPDFDDTYYHYVNSVSLKVAVPDILVLHDYKLVPRRDIKFTRENVFHRDDSKCAYCGKKFKRDELTIDHIIPKSKGGDNSWRNTISSCKICNNKKADRTPKEAGMKLLFHPTEPKWTDALSKAAARPNLRPNWLTFMKSIGVNEDD